MAELYADEHFPAASVRELRRLGYDVLTIQETGCAELKLPDAQVLHEATARDRAVLTLNRWDFIRLHRSDPNHAGIVACTYNANFAELAQAIHKMIAALPSLRGRLIRIYRP